MLYHNILIPFNQNELAALVSDAAFAVPLQAPDRGLLPAVVIAMVIAGITPKYQCNIVAKCSIADVNDVILG